MTLQVEVSRDGHKNVVYIVSGVVAEDTERVVHVTDVITLDPIPQALRLDALLYSVEDGLKVFLRWQGTNHTLPLEGRGRLVFEDMGGLTGNDVDLTTKGAGALFLMLDISKLGV